MPSINYLHVIIALLLVVIAYLVMRKNKGAPVLMDNNTMIPYVAASEINVPGGSIAIMQGDGTMSMTPAPTNSTTWSAAALPTGPFRLICNGCRITVVKTSGTYENAWNQNQVFTSNALDSITSITLYPIDSTVKLNTTNIQGYIPFSVANVPDGYYGVKLSNGEIIVGRATTAGSNVPIDANNLPVYIYGRNVHVQVTGSYINVIDSPNTISRDIPLGVNVNDVTIKTRV